jgi:alkanesulfonate monooxygenase SsuD/methylene tetrahydromethanopterin reductase-like flavin-dependent oxidoreductase (luciferase family)
MDDALRAQSAHEPGEGGSVGELQRVPQSVSHREDGRDSRSRERRTLYPWDWRGMFELEHKSLGFEFKPTPERLRALDESCRIIKSMFTNDKTNFRGKHYAVIDAVCSPKPVQRPRPQLLIAGQGENILLRIVAEHADMWNTQGSPERMAHFIEVMRRHGDKLGRDIDEIEKTVAIPLCYKGSKEREERATALAATLGRTSPTEARKQMLIGGAQECLDTIEKYSKAGVTHFMFASVAPFELDEIRSFAEEVIPQTR